MKIIDQIFCDDIRFEQHNKISLMGLYNDRIMFKIPPEKSTNIKWPIPIRLSLFLRFSLGKEEVRPDRFEFNYVLNKQSQPLISGVIKVDQELTMFNLTMVTEGLALDLGILGFNLKIYAGELVLLSESKEDALRITRYQSSSRKALPSHRVGDRLLAVIKSSILLKPLKT